MKRSKSLVTVAVLLTSLVTACAAPYKAETSPVPNAIWFELVKWSGRRIEGREEISYEVKEEGGKFRISFSLPEGAELYLLSPRSENCDVRKASPDKIWVRTLLKPMNLT